MIIEVSRVSPDGTRYEGEEPAAIVGLEDDRFRRIDAPIRYDLNAQVVSHELVVQGSLEVDVTVECSRCAGFFSTRVRDSSFLRAYAVPEGTESVDLTEDIREDILVNLPAFPVCRPDCKGLCPRCGKNWNEGLCSCKPSTGGPSGWSALDGLKIK